MGTDASEHPEGCGCAVCRHRRERLEEDPRERELAAHDDPAYEHAPPPDEAQARRDADDQDATGGQSTTVVEHHEHRQEKHQHVDRHTEHHHHVHRDKGTGRHRERRWARKHHRHSGWARTLLVGAVLIWLVHSFYPQLNIPLIPGVSCTNTTATAATPTSAGTEQAGFYIPRPDYVPLPGMPGDPVPPAAPLIPKVGGAALDYLKTQLKTIAVTAAETSLHAVGDTVRSLAVAPPSLPDIRQGLTNDAHALGRVVGFVAGGIRGDSVAADVNTATVSASTPGCGSCPTAAVPAASSAVDGIDTAARAVLRAGWTGAEAVKAVAVSGSESSYRHDARNASSASGLFQMKWPMHRDLFAPGTSWSDPYANAAAAHRLWVDQGWTPWVTVSSGAYRSHLAEARAAIARAQSSSSSHVAAVSYATSPSGSTTVDGKRVSVIAARQLRLAEQSSGIDLRVVQGGYGGDHVAASGTSHNYPGVMDVTPGSVGVEQLLRRYGFAAWARNIPGRSSVGSGAHVHAVSLLDPGDKRSPQVYGSWAHDGNGLSGANNDPAPHVAWVSNLAAQVGGAPLTTTTAAATCVQAQTLPASYGTRGGGFAIASLNVLGASHHRQGPPATRIQQAVRLLGQHRVDVVGLQELQGSQARTFDAATRGVFQRWSPSSTTENSVAWRTDTFRLLEAHELRVPYFYGHPKGMSYVRLQYLRPGGGQVWVLNVHNASSSTSRGNQDRHRHAAVGVEVQLLQRLRATGIPVLWVGDMNAHGERTRQAAATRAAGLRAASGRWADDWISGAGVTFSGATSDRGALDRAATDHPLVVARVGG